jgi:peptide/nickel transport system substrate-binding protein
VKKLLAAMVLLLVCALFVLGCSSPTATTSTVPATTTTTSSTTPPATSTPASSTPATTIPTPAAGTPVYGGTLRIAMASDVASLGYPELMQGAQDQTQARPAIESLFRLDGTGNAVPWLVDTYKEDPAAKTITLTMKKGIKFHDDTDMDATAIKWNMDTYKASAMGAGTFAFVQSIDVVDALTVRFNLTQWDNTLINNFACSPPGYIISPTAVQKNGVDWARNNPVGTGPFKLVSFQRDVKKVFQRNENYWIKGQPYLDQIEFDIIADSTVESAALIKGEVDIFSQTTPKDAVSLKQQGFKVSQATVGGGLRVLVGDSAHADSPWSNLKVRQAAAYAIDQQAIIDTVYKGLNVKTNQNAMPGTWSYNPNLAGYPYNPDKAKQLLAEAGMPSVKSTIILVNDPYQVSAYTAVQGYLAAVGIDCQLQVLDRGKYNDLQTTQGWNNALYGAGQLIAPDPLGVTGAVLSSSSTSGIGKMSIKNADIDKAISDAYQAPDFASKQKATWNFQSVVFDKYCAWIPVLLNVELATKSSKVHGDSLDDPQGSTGLWTPEAAWLEK